MNRPSPQSSSPVAASAAPAWQHSHAFGTAHPAAERGTRRVMWITAGMMVLELWAGWWFNSMALLADGWHMSSHAVAIGVSAWAYAAARRQAWDKRYAFGTWKMEVLGGFASALFLLGVAAMMVLGSLERLLQPQPIRYAEAMAVGLLGLGVNVVCALILGRAQHHAQGHGHHGPHAADAHGHGHGHGHGGGQDLNLRAAYLHVIADATTSVLAILALAGGWWLGWAWLDPLMGAAGAVLVSHWAIGLVRETSSALLDRDMDHPVVQEIREALAVTDAGIPVEMTDLHVWRVGQNSYACALTVVSADPRLDAAQLRQRLGVHEEIVHSTIEVHRR